MDKKLELRKATLDDLKVIVNIYNNAIEKMNDNGIYQWDDLYPNEEILQNDILNSQMLIGVFDNQIASIIILNQEYDNEYKNGDWQHSDSSFYVIHRLCVNPVYQGKGIGRITIQLIEEYLRKNDIESIRLDAFSLNPIALRMYEYLGYTRVGEVTWRKGLFYLYEKKL